jgi:uncharacterized protein (DUF952 family)
MTTIYKICAAASWQAAEDDGSFAGSQVDRDDGYIHFSTAAQLGETAVRHFAGQHDLMLVAVDAGRLGDALKWEPARSGDLFPHLYKPLELAAVLWAKPLPLGTDGRYVFPALDQ